VSKFYRGVAAFLACFISISGAYGWGRYRMKHWQDQWYAKHPYVRVCNITWDEDRKYPKEFCADYFYNGIDYEPISFETKGFSDEK
jgi:hypothetical protein